MLYQTRVYPEILLLFQVGLDVFMNSTNVCEHCFLVLVVSSPKVFEHYSLDLTLSSTNHSEYCSLDLVGRSTHILVQ